MRKWFKYILDYGVLKDRDCPYIDSLGEANDRERFFDIYFNSNMRPQFYDRYLRSVIDRDSKVLSIGSGRCANELWLMRNGFDVTCSDLLVPFRDKLLQLFPELRYCGLDILKSPTEKKFDCIIALSVFYQFDKEDLFRAFNNSSRSLNRGGRLILDIGGAEDNLFTFFLDEFVCRFEAISRWGIKKAFRKDGGFTVKRVHHGYRNTNQEIVSIAEEVGFKLKGIKALDFETELSRSILLTKMTQMIPALSIPLKMAGRLAPYIRMFDFKKLTNHG